MYSVCVLSDVEFQYYSPELSNNTMLLY